MTLGSIKYSFPFLSLQTQLATLCVHVFDSLLLQQESHDDCILMSADCCLYILKVEIICFYFRVSTVFIAKSSEQFIAQGTRDVR